MRWVHYTEILSRAHPAAAVSLRLRGVVGREAMRLQVLLSVLLVLAGAPAGARRRGGASPAGVSQGAFELAAHVLAPDIFADLPRSFLPEFKARSLSNALLFRLHLSS